MRRIFSCVSFLALLGVASGCGSIKARQAMQRGIGYYKVHKYELAANEFKAATDINPGWTEAWLNRGYSCKQAFIPASVSEKDKEFANCAIDSFKGYLNLMPAGKEHDNATEMLVTVYNDAHRQEEGLVYFMQLHEKEPDNIHHVQALRALSQSKGDFEATVKWLELELKMNSGTDEVAANERKTLQYTLCAIYEGKVRPTNSSSSALSTDEKFATIEKGLGYCKSAIDADPKYAEAVIDFSLLSRWRSKYTLDQTLLLDEKKDKEKIDEMKAKATEDIRIADEYRLRATDLFKARRAEEAAKAGIPLPSAAPTPAPAASAPASTPAASSAAQLSAPVAAASSAAAH